jgi:membrane-associated phospholipid phosphatase
MSSIMQTMDEKGTARLRLGGAWVAFGLVAWIATLPLMHRLDEVFTGWLQRASPLLDLPAAILVRLGNAEIVITGAAVAAILLYLKNARSGTGAMWLVAALAAASVLAVTLKHVIVHPGPPDYLVRPGLGGGLYLATPYSFPSGHTLRATLLAGTALRTSRGLAGALVASMMLALVYMGGHWLSDVLGGLCLGWALIETGRAIRTTRSQNYLRD